MSTTLTLTNIASRLRAQHGPGLLLLARFVPSWRWVRAAQLAPKLQPHTQRGDATLAAVHGRAILIAPGSRRDIEVRFTDSAALYEFISRAPASESPSLTLSPALSEPIPASAPAPAPGSIHEGMTLIVEYGAAKLRDYDPGDLRKLSNYKRWRYQKARKLLRSANLAQ